MSGFTSGGESFDRIFMTDYEIVDQFVGSGLRTFGQNNVGQLGDGTTTARSSPVTTAGAGTNWKQVVAGSTDGAATNSTTAGIKTDGTLWTWGSSLNGALGDNTTTNRSSPGTTAGAGTNWKQVAIGYATSLNVNARGAHVLAIKTDGTLWTWGNNFEGQLGDGTTTSRSSPGTTAGGGTNWKQVALTCGLRFTAAIKTDGTLWTWGRNDLGALGDSTITPRSSPGQTAGLNANWKQVACGYAYTAAVKTDGTLWTWGDNGSGQLGTNTTTARSSPGQTAGLNANWKQVTCGAFHTAAVKTDGTLWTWGGNSFGNLGDGTTTGRSSPGTTAGGGTNWKQTATGIHHTAAVKTDGTLWTWGRNNSGQLGDNTITNRSSPGTTVSNSDWKQISCGTYYTAAIEQ